MKKMLACAIVAAVTWVSSGEQQAQAQGVHLGVGGVHVDVGRPHGGYYGHRSHYRGGGYYRGGYGGGWSGYGGHRDWHSTSHYDYHPGGYERHYNHFDYTPGHYDFHSQGHFDYHR